MGCSNNKQIRSSFLDTYTLGSKIGAGAFAQVRLCRHKVDNEQRAVKIISKPYSKVDFLAEISLLSEVNAKDGCSNIVKFYEFYEDSYFFYSVMEHCSGGEVFSKISQVPDCTERQLALWVTHVLNGLDHIHKAGIVHRDVKPQNLIFKDGKKDTIKLIDFGLSYKMAPNELLDEACGTPEFVAPEMILGRYGRKIDIWAVGVIFYMLLFGRCPFMAQTEQELFQNIVEKEPHWTDELLLNQASEGNSAVWAAFDVATSNFNKNKYEDESDDDDESEGGAVKRGGWSPSTGAQMFCATLLTKNVRERPTASQALSNPWLLEMMELGRDTTQVVPVSVRSLAHMSSIAVKHDENFINQTAHQGNMKEMDIRLDELTAKQHDGTTEPCSGFEVKFGLETNSAKTSLLHMPTRTILSSRLSNATGGFGEGLQRAPTRSNVAAYQNLQLEMNAVRLRTPSRAVSRDPSKQMSLSPPTSPSE
eukprot:GHVN01078608.1.p1 GENE.GHVN01078608.1~~GHVN01078608.1.p1  ORF type:complete len:477 (-),score=57.87 GHVN01078608.1:1427-2857(-)